jgi:DNA-binding PucR family transcriptional regulator
MQRGVTGAQAPRARRNGEAQGGLLLDRSTAYREAALSLSYTSSVRPVVSLDDLSSLECALIGADATTKAVIAAKGSDLQTLSDEDLSTTYETVRAFSKADLNVARAAQQMHVHPNTVRVPTPADRYHDRT